MVFGLDFLRAVQEVPCAVVDAEEQVEDVTALDGQSGFGRGCLHAWLHYPLAQ